MDNKNNRTTAYLLLVISLGVALAVSGKFVGPLPGLLLGTLVLSPITLALMRQLSVPRSLLLWGGMAVITWLLSPTTGIALLSIALWYTGALIINIGTRLTPDMFSLLLQGGFIFILAVCLGGAVLVKEHYGVWDFMGVYTGIENIMLQGLAVFEKFCQTTLSTQQMELYTPILTALRDGVDSLVHQVLSLALVSAGGLYLYTMKVGQFISRSFNHPVMVAPLMLYSVPREITWCYIAVFLISFLITDETYVYALNITITLMNWLFVPAGIGFLDTFIRNKWTPASRTTAKAVLFFLAFLSDNFSSTLLFTALCVIGIIVSLSRRIIFAKGEDK